ncbi:MAG TPA: CHAT domain-containing tetratricopeptide repeat protein [Cyclobacteriaceae bacterium]|nr:CHAT domain-containing tetratricopeptide repeat protein [Cyclobacteriaceae bacterium]
MRIPGFTTLIALIWLFMAMPAFSQKWQKDVDKIDAQYLIGSYPKAAKLNEKLRKKSAKKLGQENAYLITYYLNKAKINIATGELQTYENELNFAVALSERVHSAAPQEHAMTLLGVAGLYCWYGNYAKALGHWNNAIALLNQSGKNNGRHKVFADLVKIKIDGGMGYYKKAIALSSASQDDMKKNLESKGTRFNPVTKTEGEASFSKVEMEQRQSDYAYFLSFAGYCLGMQGYFAKSDSAFLVADTWIRKAKGRISREYAQYQVLKGDVEDLFGNWRDSRKLYKDAYDNLKVKVKPAHYLIYDAHEKLIATYAFFERDVRSTNEFNAFDAAVKKNFSKNSIYRMQTDFLDLKLNKDNRNNTTLERYGNAILNAAYLPADNPRRAELLSFLADINANQQEFNNAVEHISNYLKVREICLGSDAPNFHASRIIAGNYYINYTDNLALARDIYENSFTESVLKELSPDHPSMSQYLRFTSKVHQESDRLKEAVEDLKTAVEIVKKKYGENSIEYGVDINGLADLYIEASDFKSARNYINSANEILKKETADAELTYYATSLETEARLLRVEGEYDNAISTIKRSQKMVMKSKVINYNSFRGIETLAEVYLSLGKFSSTGDLLTRSIEIKEDLYGRESRFLIQPLLRSGDLLTITGDYPEAEKAISRATAIASRVYGEKSARYAECLVQQTKLHLALGDFEEGDKYANRALEIQKSIFADNNIVVANTLSLMGEIGFYNGEDLRELENHFLESESIIIKLLGSGNPLFAENLKNLGIIFLARNNYERSLGLFEQSKAIWQFKAGKRNNINTADISVLIGDVYYMRRDFAKAEANYKEAQKLYKKFFSDTHPKYVKTLSKLSKVSYMKGDLRNAKNDIQGALDIYLQFITNYFPSLSERGKAKFWASIRPDFEYYSTLAIRLNSQYPEMISTQYNIAIATKALLLNSSIKVRERILSSSDTTLHQLYYLWKDKNELLTNALSMSAEELQEEGINTDNLKSEIENLEKDLSVRTEGFGSAFEKKSITWENVKSALGPGEAAVEVIRFRYFSHVFTDSIIYMGLYVTNSSAAPQYFTLANGKNLETKLFSGYRNAIKFRINDEQSYTHFWQPFEKALGKSTTIYLSPDGVFNQINLEAIPTPDGKYVLDNSNIILVNNTKDLFIRKASGSTISRDRTATLVGNPKFYAAGPGRNQGFTEKPGTVISDLPGTAAEIVELNKILVTDGWKTKDYLYDSATETNLKGITNPEIFHIATHGFFTSEKSIKSELEGIAISDYEALENPLLRTGLLLSGAGDLLASTTFNYNFESGILTAYEAMNLNLDNTKLVVLSACETGLGDVEVGEGVYGLQRAFLVAGARTLIMSLFKVSDEATQKLMVTFYDNWLRTGNERQAFVEAKKEIRNEFRYPIYWGAFVMIGLD